MSSSPEQIALRIRQARLAAGLSLEELASRLERPISKQALSKYEHGQSQPSASMLAALAQALEVKTSSLLSSPRASVTWLGFRKHAQLGVNAQERITATATLRLEHELQMRDLFGIGLNHSVPIGSGEPTFDGAESAATTLRHAWGLGDLPISSVIETVEEKGGIVLAWPEDDRFDGLSGEADVGCPVVVFNTTRSIDRVRYDVAHELGHLVMADSGDEKTNEALAHRFGAAFLVPDTVARKELGEHRQTLSFAELGLLKKRWGLSMQAWTHRAHDLGIIGDSHYKSLWIQFSKNGWRRVEPVQFEGIEEPMLLRRLLHRALIERVITRDEARVLFPDYDLQPEAALESQRVSFREIVRFPRAERDAILRNALAEVEQSAIDEWNSVDSDGLEVLSD